MPSVILKLMALITMTIDHFGAILWFIPEYYETGVLMRQIGRIAFPIYVFLIAVGMLKTRSREKYLLRLFAFAIISFVPFSLFCNAVYNGLDAKPVYLMFSYINVFFTLFLGAAAIYVYDLAIGRVKGFLGYIIGAVGTAVCILAADFLNTDYGSFGAGVIFFTYLVMSLKDNRFLRILPVVLWVYLQYKQGVYMWFAMAAPLMILLYNGKPGPTLFRGKMKFAFYAYYPVHLFLAYLLSVII